MMLCDIIKEGVWFKEKMLREYKLYKEKNI